MAGSAVLRLTFLIPPWVEVKLSPHRITHTATAHSQLISNFNSQIRHIRQVHAKRLGSIAIVSDAYELHDERTYEGGGITTTSHIVLIWVVRI